MRLEKFLLVAIILLFVLIGISFVYAGEKEEATLKIQLLQERIGRLQAEFQVTQQELQKAIDDFKVKFEQPKVEKPKEGKK